MDKKILTIVLLVLCSSVALATNYQYLMNPYTRSLDRSVNLNQTGNNFTADYLFGNLPWNNLTNYPTPCPAYSYLTQLNDSVTCTAISYIDNNLEVNGNVTADNLANHPHQDVNTIADPYFNTLGVDTAGAAAWPFQVKTASGNLNVIRAVIGDETGSNNIFFNGGGLGSAYGTNGNALMYINYNGYQGGANQYRDLWIGNGRTGNIMYVDGSTSRVGINDDSPDALIDATSSTNGEGIRVTNTVQHPALEWWSENANAGTRNWGTFTNYGAWGDWVLRYSNAKDGSPYNAGTTAIQTKSDGSVGLPTATAGVRLTVGGNLKIDSTNRLYFSDTGEGVYSPSAGVMAYETRGYQRVMTDTNNNDPAAAEAFSVYTADTYAGGTATQLISVLKDKTLEIGGTIDSDGLTVLDSGFVGMAWKLAGTTNLYLYSDATLLYNQFALPDGFGNQLVFTNEANRNKDHDHNPTTDPTLFIQSDTDPDVDNTQWISITHNKSAGVIESGNGSIIIDDNLDVAGNITGNQIYGGMWYHNSTGTTLSFAVQDTWYPLFFTNATDLNGFSYVGGFEASSNLTAEVSGKYQVSYMGIGSGQNNHVYLTTILIDGVAKPKCGNHHKMAAGGDVITQSGVCIITINAGQTVAIATQDMGGTGDGVYYGGNLNLVRIGD